MVGHRVVAWYNGHPDYQDLEFDLSGERAVVVGAGNVALDVLRMLALTREELAPTDATDASIEAIASSGLRDLVMLARRGPAQAAFTTPELKELGELAGADVIVDPAQLELDPVSEAVLEHDTNARRNLEVLREFAAREPVGKPKTVRLRFLVSPVAILGEERVEAVEVVRNTLVDDGRGGLKAVAGEERETIPCSLVFRSVGYHGVPLAGRPVRREPGHAAERRRAGARRRRPADPGRLLRGLDQARPDRRDRHEQEGRHRDRAAAPRGRPGGKLARSGASSNDVVELLAERDAEAVLYAGWEAIDAVERASGAEHGRPRVKLCSWDALLAAAREAART